MITCIGDSFTAGAELDDVNLAWPILLGNLLNCKITNLGKGGTCNDRILKRAMDTTFNKSSDLIIVAWSTPVRSEIADANGVFNYWPGKNLLWVNDNYRKDITRLTTVFESDNLYKWAHRRWLRSIILLQTFFKAHNQRYLMIQGHGSQIENHKWIVNTDLHRDLADHIDPEFLFGWPVEGIVEWVGDAPRGPHGHPLELGQERIAEKLNEHIRNLGWLP